MTAVAPAVAATAAIATASGAVSLIILSQLGTRRSRRTPPSVGRYPLIGSHLHLPEPWPRSIYEKFGNAPVVLMHMGTAPVYIFNNWAAFKEAMIDNADDMSGRVSQFMAERIFGDRGGLVASDGDLWREYRRFTLRVLRDFGLGRREGEGLVVEEADHLTRAIESHGGAPFDPGQLLSSTTSNIICQLVFGSRLGSEDPNFSEILEIFRAITQNEDTNVNNSVTFSLLPIVQLIPQLMPLFTESPAAKNILMHFGRLLDYCKLHREKQAAELANVDKARNYIEAHLLQEQQQPKIFNDTRMMMSVADLFIAGTDTTSNTLRWLLLFMIDHPSIADKVRNEIYEALGTERTPTMADKVRLPYTLATIEEALRCSSLIHMGLLHRTLSDIKVAGYDIPADTICAFNVYAIHHDPELFPQPMEFRPERHMHNSQFVACEHIAGFGVGRRACLGEGLARSELLIFFSVLMQRFSFQLDPTEKTSVWQLTKDPSLFKGSIMRALPDHRIAFTRL